MTQDRPDRLLTETSNHDEQSLEAILLKPIRFFLITFCVSVRVASRREAVASLRASGDFN